MGQHTNEVERIPNGGWDTRILVGRNGRLVQCFIVVTHRYVVVVDTCINPVTARLMLGMARDHLPDRRLMVVNTHADYDHCWGNSVYAGPDAVFPAPIVGHALCAQLFRQPEAATYLNQMKLHEPEIFADVTLQPPDLLFDERMVIHGGDLTLELFHAPGHTSDHIALYIPEIRTLLAADAAEVPFPFAREVSGLPVMRRSLAELAALEPEVALYCHAPVEIGPRLLQANIAYFDAVEAACRDALARGIPAQPGAQMDVAALVGLSYADAVPADPAWESVNDYYKTDGHAQQIRMMLRWLASESE